MILTTKQLATLKIWFMAMRPKTLTAAVGPIMMGTAMAFGDGSGHALTAFICLFTALLLQIGTNIANDYFDFKKGADTAERVGPTRVTQAGLLSAETIRRAFIICFLLAAIGWFFLIVRAGWPMAVLAISSILSGIFYTAGSKALAYIGLGDLFVFIFFGPIAVAGTYYAQSLELHAAPIIAGIAPGLISVAILAVNNLRDIHSDAQSNKRTLAVRFGVAFTRLEYLAALLGAAFIPVLLYLLIGKHAPILISAVLSLLAIPVIHLVLTEEGAALNAALAKTGQLLLIYSVLFSIGWLF
jgi:1,4-dihydroxy-2-naphthoate octaprenyltransferase